MPGDRAAIIMSNQSKWLISAYAIFHGGGVLVPLDYKLTAAEHLQLLAHSKAKVLVIEYYLWRAIIQSPEFKEYNVQTVLVTEAPPGADLGGGLSLGGLSPQGRAGVCTAPASRRGLHRVFVRDRRTSQGLRAHS